MPKLRRGEVFCCATQICPPVEQADRDRLWQHGRPLCNVSVKSDFFEDIWASPEQERDRSPGSAWSLEYLRNPDYRHRFRRLSTFDLSNNVTW